MARVLREQRPLYIIAPSLWQCREAALAHGLDPETLENTRSITSAYQLRGTRPGTPFITHRRENWVRSMPGIYELDQAIDLLTRTGRLRVAGDDDIAAARGEQLEARA
ncbi:hypothetical protein [Hoeflea sp. EC-HK425]|uniref:hypothetical protein n=1 Tax=Hoeflea sp. EC-HK425 TaxID=2038388 RepID=UPI00125EED15|nr:hypothetical protein [Hoeflea sp. EC-HK425]